MSKQYSRHANKAPRKHGYNKYRVARKRERTWNGVVYASKAEMLRAQELATLVSAGSLVNYERQVPIALGDDFGTVVDFLVHETDDIRYAEEVKGYETREFKRVRKLWAKYGPCPLKILKRVGGTWCAEILEGGTNRE